MTPHTQSRPAQYAHLAARFLGEIGETRQIQTDPDQFAIVIGEVVERIEQLTEVLGRVPQVLGVKESKGLRSSILILLPEHKMAGLVGRDARTGPFISETYKKFRWGVNIKPSGLAGICATIVRPIVISDLSDRTHPYIDYWIGSRTKHRSAMVLPVFSYPVKDGITDRKCVGVLTITSSKPGELVAEHCVSLSGIVEKIGSIVSPPISPSQDTGALDGQQSTSYYLDMRKEVGGRNPSEQTSPWQTTLTEIISELENRSGPGEKPSKAIEMLKVFQAASQENIWVTMENLLPYFQDAQDPARKVAAFIGHLNSRYLKPRGIKIMGTVGYSFGSYEEEQE